MSPSKRTEKVAFMEDCSEGSDSSLEGKEGTRTYALSEAPLSPTKELPNTSKSRSEKRPSARRTAGSSSSGSSYKSGQDHQLVRAKSSRRPRDIDGELREQELRRRDREQKELLRKAKAEDKAAKESSKAFRKRPTSLKQSQTETVVQQTAARRAEADDPRFYGIQQAAVSGSRPRAQTRPQTYYAGQPPRPPIANMGWHQNRMPGPPFPAGGNFAPPMMYGGPPGPGMHAPPPPSPSMAPGSYFDQPPPLPLPLPQQHPQHGKDLRQRFDRKLSNDRRPSSALGYRTSSGGYSPEEYDYDEPLSPRASRPRTTKLDEDRRRMPPPEFLPPQRSKTSVNPSTPFRPPPGRPTSRPPSRQNSLRPPNINRRSVGFVDQPGYADDDFLGDDGLFHDISPEPVHGRRKSVSRRGSLVYENESYDLVPANSRGRRSSMYGRGLSGGGVSLEGESKYFDAMRYQEDVSGGPQVPLTAETLRKANKRETVASSRSTRSSGSRDESEYRRSSATGITRSSSGGQDDVTIKVAGSALVRMQGAEVEWGEEGGEITFTQRSGGPRYGSEKASTIYQIEDTRSRIDPRKALPMRSRAPSQSDSQSRGYAPSSYGPTYAPYDPMLSGGFI